MKKLKAFESVENMWDSYSLIVLSLSNYVGTELARKIARGSKRATGHSIVDRSVTPAMFQGILVANNTASGLVLNMWVHVGNDNYSEVKLTVSGRFETGVPFTLTTHHAFTERNGEIVDLHPRFVLN